MHASNTVCSYFSRCGTYSVLSKHPLNIPSDFGCIHGIQNSPLPPPPPPQTVPQCHTGLYYNCQIKIRRNFLHANIMCMAIPYRTPKFPNILPIAIWAQPPNLIPANISGYTVYRIAGNFRGRKLSRIGRKGAFHGENFHRILKLVA